MNIVLDGVEVYSEEVLAPSIGIGGRDIGKEIMELLGKGLLVPDLIDSDDITLHDTAIVGFEVIVLRTFILLQHDNGESALAQVPF